MALPAVAQRLEYEEEPHNYWSAPLTDDCTKLDAALKSGAAVLELANEKELVRGVLRHLKIDPATQVLVFSKTSLQKDRIGPQSPRAVWFNDDTYAAWVPGGVMELGGTDPVLGPVFYSLNPNRPDRPVPRLDRQESCMNCHGGSMTNQVPGYMVRSVFPDRDGQMLLQAGTALVDHTTPLEKRWGGWYVTGSHGSAVHMGNAIAAQAAGGEVTLDTAGTGNLKSLEKFFDAARYPRADSDIVALMVLEHQVAMHGRLTEAGYALRTAAVRQKALQAELGDPVTDEYTGSAKVVAESHAEKVLRCLLFAEEAALPDGGVDGGPDFAAAFRSNRRALPDGRSLKDLQLLTRLFKYRCSYLIYSAQWDALPPPFLRLLYTRLLAILTAQEPVKEYAYLSAAERRDILEILRVTKPGLPEAWRAAHSSSLSR